MANAVHLVCLCVLTAGLGERGWGAPVTDGEHASCRVWDGIARQLTSNVGEAQQECRSEGTDPCTRIDCSGAYQYNSKNALGFSLGESAEVDYCMGIVLNHCSPNISLDFYIQVPEKGVDKKTRVFHNTLLSIPRLSYSIGTTVKGQAYLYFEMARKNDSVTFSVTVKVRVTFNGKHTWPSPYQQRLIQRQTIPVPPCDPGVKARPAPHPALSQCRPARWKNQQVPGVPLPGLAGDLDKPCNETEHCSKDPWLLCDVGTQRCACLPDYRRVKGAGGQPMCQPLMHHDKPCLSDKDCSLQMSERCVANRCQCQQGDAFNSLTFTCEPIQDAETSQPQAVTGDSAAVHHSQGEPDTKSSHNKSAVVAGAVVGGVVVLGGILLAAYFAIRRLRGPYTHRQLLLEGEDGDGIM